MAENVVANVMAITSVADVAVQKVALQMMEKMFSGKSFAMSKGLITKYSSKKRSFVSPFCPNAPTI